MAGFAHWVGRHPAHAIPQPRLSSAFCVSCLGPRAYRVADEANRGKWSDKDAYGQVNNAIYYLWFDTVVDAWLIELELPDVSAGDPIEIALAIERLRMSSVTYRSGAFQPEVVAQASFVHVYIDRAKRRPVSLPAP